MIQNDDIAVRVTVKDADGDPILISGLNALEIYIYDLVKAEKVLKATYRKGNTGLYKINTINDAGGIVEIIINRQMTRTFTSSKVYLETKAQFNVSSDFISSLQNVGAPGVEIDTLEKTANNNTLL